MADGAIRIATSAKGFPRPVRSGPVADEAARTIAAICPGLGQTVATDGRRNHILWGPYLGVEAGWAADADLRFKGASGGALSALLVHLVESGWVDRVLQTGAGATGPIANETRLTDDRTGIAGAAGSRYAPSSPLADLGPLIGSGLRHAFVGKPCDAAALRAWAVRDPQVARTFPVILSFFCAGVPSAAGGAALLAAMGADPLRVTDFRYRGNGWPGDAVANLNDGSERRMSYRESWGKILSKHVQHRCKICADGTGMAADLVCADAWETDAEGYPLFEERDGISLVMARTGLGQAILAEAKAAGRIVTRPFDPDRIAAIQPGQRERRRALLARLTALRLMGRPVPRYRGLRLLTAARQNPAGRNLRNLLGMIRRTMRPT
ncbi:MAG: Coenzyme F420 hydrogenase/dehydrogenase, beta subunit C-terminal domain [Paracoccaceae bacterium]